MKPVGRYCVAISLACALAACGPGSTGIPDGTFETVISGSRPELDGTWALTLEPDGRFRIALDGQTTVTGRYSAGDGQVTFTDESGPMMCAAGLTRGTYNWSIEESRLTLVAVVDDCPGRRGILGQQPYARKAARLTE